jgi:hypothetical protein
LGNDDIARDTKRRGSRTLLATVGLGMVLFVFGFVLAVTSLSDPGTASSDEVAMEASNAAAEGASFTLLLGLLMSLGGVVLATAGPAMMFIHARKEST